MSDPIEIKLQYMDDYMEEHVLEPMFAQLWNELYPGEPIPEHKFTWTPDGADITVNMPPNLGGDS